MLHYAVGNIPGAVPHTSTYALTNATLPYVVALATQGVADATARRAGARRGVNTAGGVVTNPAVAEALGRVRAARRRADALDSPSAPTVGHGVRPARPARRSATGASSGTATSGPNIPAFAQVVDEHALRHLVGDAERPRGRGRCSARWPWRDPTRAW